MPPDQQDAYEIAEYECTAMYFVDPRVVQPITPERLSLIYDYFSEFVVPCLIEQGRAPTEPLPSRQVFIDAGGLWNGYPRGDAEMQDACPQNPPSRALLGEDY